MDYNESVWHYYQPGYVHPAFVPYMVSPVRDPWGNVVEVNTWNNQGYADGSVNPALVRRNWGMKFMKQFDTDPCPMGFAPAPGGYCTEVEIEHEPVFYTDKAFLTKNQYWNSYVEDGTKPRRISSSFDLRSVNPLTGRYTVYYQPNLADTGITYGLSPTSDSYL